MNKAILCGRLVRDPETRYSQGENKLAISNYTLAVERKGKKKKDNKEQSTDFINCIAFGKLGEFSEKYFSKGLRVLVSGRIQTGSYTNRDGNKVYTTNIVVEEQEFADSKNNNHTDREDQDPGVNPYGNAGDDGFITYPDGIDPELPFA